MSNATPLTSDPDRDVYIILGATHGKIRKTLYDAVEKQAKTRLPELIRGKSYTAEKLLSNAFWAELDTKGNRIHAGMVLSHLVANHALPLSVVKTKHEFPKHYALI